MRRQKSLASASWQYSRPKVEYSDFSKRKSPDSKQPVNGQVTMLSCPSREQWQQHLVREQDDTEDDVLENHVRECAACFRLLEELTASELSASSLTGGVAVGLRRADSTGMVRLKET